ncbi:hypothetical protein BGW42_000167 [Actinomortierella wolfii]|nr:hypothetical protein BGW42_000167 [Actinomortierella wolfii]
MLPPQRRPPPSLPTVDLVMSPVVPAAPFVPYPTMAPSCPQPLHTPYAVHSSVPMTLSAGVPVVPGVGMTPLSAAGASASWTVPPGQPLQPTQPSPYHLYPATSSQQYTTMEPTGLYDMAVIASPVLAPPPTSSSSSSSSSSNSSSGTHNTTSTTTLTVGTPEKTSAPATAAVQIPSLVTIYRCDKCGATLPSENAVCTRLHAGGSWFGPEKIQQMTTTEAIYEKKSARRVDKQQQQSGPSSDGLNGHLASSTSSSSLPSSTAQSVSTPAAMAHHAVSPVIRPMPLPPLSPTVSGNHSGGRDVNHSNGIGSSNNPNQTSAEAGYVPPPPSRPLHDPAAIYDLRRASSSAYASSSSSSSHLTRAKTTQNPVVAAKKLWRDFRKDIPQQENEKSGSQQQQNRIIISPENTTVSGQGTGNTAPMGQYPNYPLPPGMPSMPGGLQRHPTVYHIPNVPPYPYAGDSQIRPSAPAQLYPLPPP